MSGYQAIPSAATDHIENGVPSNSHDEGISPTTRVDVRAVPSLASKLGYISFGVIAGCLLSGGLSQRGPGVDKHPAPAASASQTFLIDGTSFLDALPFEEVTPLHWRTARAHGKTASELSRRPTGIATIDEETASVAAPLLGASSAAPHLLYHAHESSFSLLYDSSKSSNSYLSEYSLDYFLLNTGGSDAQINQAYCSLATVASVLNSLRYTKRFLEKGDLSKWSFNLPVDPVYAPYPYATQTDILRTDCVRDTVIDHNDGAASDARGLLAPPYGLSLEQAAKLLTCHVSDEWDVTATEVDPARLSVSNMRYEIKVALIDPDARVMINYDRKGLGQLGGGHFSPLGAYDRSTDSFLILDVAKYKYPPVWVGADTLFAAMATVDQCGTWDYPNGQARVQGTPSTPEDYRKTLELLNCQQKMRGYVILKKRG